MSDVLGQVEIQQEQFDIVKETTEQEEVTTVPVTTIRSNTTINQLEDYIECISSASNVTEDDC